jgi:L,D-peptidoglycan transpeptidase YkuD (ErfK/YbiS/YcfS/YnhG family)
MDLIVRPTRGAPTRGHVSCDSALFDCALGQQGITTNKREGDGATPQGRFALRRVFYRADRIIPPVTGLPVTPLKQNDGWCDAPDDVRYNLPVEHPYAARAERLWRADHRYDVLVTLGHNDDPIVPGAGSAIFLHVAADDFRATEGCVAMRCDDLLSVLARCSPSSMIDIQTLASP